MNEKSVILKPGKEKAIKNRHHWIFSGAILESPKYGDGEILPVNSSKGELLGSAYFNRKSSIIGRMVAFDSTPPVEAIKKNIDAAIAMRSVLFSDNVTNVYRLVNGEGDRLPGLVVDKYADVIVIQIATLGMDKLRSLIVQHLVERLKPRAIYEKSQVPSRKEEGLIPLQQQLYGPPVDCVEVIENKLKFSVSILEGQKTGFFIDHREMRSLVRTLSQNRRVLNCFSYSGAFSVYALAGGASRVDSVDISDKAVEDAKHNAALNGYTSNAHGFHVADVFQFLRENPVNYDLVILDPPAFAKKQRDVIAACRGYKDINRVAMQKMPPGSLLLTCSCSHHVDADLFQKVVFQATVEANRNARIIGSHRMAADHPINICHPESDYLKSLLLYIE